MFTPARKAAEFGLWNKSAYASWCDPFAPVSVVDKSCEVFRLILSLVATICLSDMDHESRIRLWAFSHLKWREEKGRAKYREVFFCRINQTICWDRGIACYSPIQPRAAVLMLQLLR